MTQTPPASEVETPAILLIEDDQDLCESLGLVLSKNGYRIVKSSRTADAITKLRNQLFSCVLLDMKLDHGGQGEEVIVEIRKSKRELNAETPIVIISGNLDAELIQRVGAHVSGVLVKPFNNEALLAKLGAVMAG